MGIEQSIETRETKIHSLRSIEDLDHKAYEESNTVLQFKHNAQAFEKVFAESDFNAHEALRSTKKTPVPIEMIHGGLEERVLMGQDTTQAVEQNRIKSLPYSAVMRVEMRFGESLYVGMAALIGPRYAVTAKFNLCITEKSEEEGLDGKVNETEVYADSVRVVPGDCEGEESFGSVYVQFAFLFKDCNLGLLVLNKEMGEKTGYLEMRAVDGLNYLETKTIQVVGYPYKEEETNKIYVQEGRICESQGNMHELVYAEQTGLGQYGSPILMKGEGKEEYLLIGVHSGSETGGEEVNYATVLNSERVNLIRAWIKQLEQKLASDKKEQAALRALVDVERERAISSHLDKFFKFEETEGIFNVHRLYHEKGKITDNEIRDLARLIRIKGMDIRHLELNFDGCDKISNVAIFELVKRIGPSIKNIEDLNVGFSSCKKISDVGVIELAKLIGPNIHKARRLVLNFQWCKEITDQGVIELARQIGSNAQNLEHLSLNFSGCEKISDNAVIEITNQIEGSIRNLQVLELSFSNSLAISDNGLIQFARRIAPVMQNMKGLSLNFAACKRISDNGINELAKQIGPKIQNLQSLYLFFPNSLKGFFDNYYWYQIISDNGAMGLAKEIGSNIPNIRVLCLSFNKCGKITNNGAKELAQNIASNLKKITQVTFWLQETGITGKGIRHVKEVFNFAPTFHILA